MKKYLVILFLLVSCVNVDAGISVCPDSDGPINSFRLSGSPLPNCHYFTNESPNYISIRDLLKSTPKRFLDIVSGDVVKKSQAAIDAILLAEQTASDAAQDLSTRSGAKGGMDNFDSNGLVLRALAEIIRGEINILRSQHGLAPRTLDQLKISIKNKIDSGEVD